MCCIVALMALIGPRAAFLFAWIFTNEVDQSIDSFWMKLLGLVFLPWTALFWVIAWAPLGGVSGFGVVLVAFGFALDIASYTSGVYSRRG
ncbi:MAG TPA: hypothetical protein VMW94_08035 [Actinomycetes bacterium]|nr:hypothetical protein [Actinomycetes bacterium]